MTTKISAGVDRVQRIAKYADDKQGRACRAEKSRGMPQLMELLSRVFKTGMVEVDCCVEK